MGFALCRRLLDAGHELWVYNRTRAKAEPLEELGAKVVDSPGELNGREIVFTMVAGPRDVLEVTTGSDGVLAGDSPPSILVDSTTIDPATSQKLRDGAAQFGTSVLAAPVSGNAEVVKSGKLTVVASGPRDAYDTAVPYLKAFGRRVTYVGDLDQARLVKLCHNLHLGVVTQSLAEITMLAEAAGVSRHDFLEFFNDSVMGSTFTRYKSPAFINLDWTPTFTWHLLRKDLELGLATGRESNVPMHTAALVHQLVLEGIGRGLGDMDFAALLEMQAEASGKNLESENREVPDGLD
jgi:3-hydroxyisobutyrate dehydrogenase